MPISFPSSPVAGTSIYAGGRQWTYDGTSWNLVLGGAYELQWTKTASGGEITLTGASDAGTTLTYQLGNDNVYLNGVLMARNVDYTATTGNSITFTVALNPSDVVTVVSFNQLQLASSNIATGTEPTTYTPGMVWVNTTGTAQAFNFTRWRLSVASSTTTLSGADDNALTLSYTPGLEEVFINGAMLVRGLDYTASNGISISLTVGVVAGDVVEVVNPVTMTASVAVPSTTATAKGDILAATSSGTVSRLGVGPDNYLLKADSTQATGLNWMQYPPRGTTAQRPVSPTVGDIYFDTTLQQLINYTSYGWSVVGATLPVVTGGTLTSDATYYYRTFTTTGTLSVTNAPLTADLLIVAGGGGNGGYCSGGGGAGGLVAYAAKNIPVSSYTVTVGAGGAYGSNGANSSISGLSLTTAVGGGVSSTGGGSTTYLAQVGGSGGGGAVTNSSTWTGAAGTSGQGNAGGSFTGGSTAGNYAAGAGGGAGAAGANSTSYQTTGAAGGVGLATYSSWGAATSTGQNVGGTYYYAGGGGGFTSNNYSGGTLTGGPGGYGGGGLGASASSDSSVTVNGSDGAAYTGGGAGGGGHTGGTGGPGTVGWAGGSGVIIVRYTRASVGG